MTERRSSSAGADEEALDIDYFERVISEIFSKEVSILNTETFEISFMTIGYKIFQDYEKIPEIAFSGEDEEWLEENSGPGTVFIAGYKQDEADIYEITSLTLEDLAEMLDGAIRQGSFMSQQFSETLENITLRLFKKYDGGKWIPVSSGLFARTSSVIFKDGVPVLVVKGDPGIPFFNAIKKDFSQRPIGIILNFCAPDIISFYDDPKKLFFESDAEGEEYEIVFMKPDMDKLIHMTTEKEMNGVFDIKKIESVDDYRNMRKILEENYGDLQGILDALMEDRLGSDADDLMDLVD